MTVHVSLDFRRHEATMALQAAEEEGGEELPDLLKEEEDTWVDESEGCFAVLPTELFDVVFSFLSLRDLLPLEDLEGREIKGALRRRKQSVRAVRCVHTTRPLVDSLDSFSEAEWGGPKPYHRAAFFPSYLEKDEIEEVAWDKKEGHVMVERVLALCPNIEALHIQNPPLDISLLDQLLGLVVRRGVRALSITKCPDHLYGRLRLWLPRLRALEFVELPLDESAAVAFPDARHVWLNNAESESEWWMDNVYRHYGVKTAWR